LLFEKYNDDVKITEEVVEAATRNKENGKTIIQLFFKKCGDNIKIIEKEAKTVAENGSKAIIQLFLEKYNDDVKITEEVVKVVVILI